jgi:hypothetical protein
MGRNYLDYLGRDGKVILKLSLKKDIYEGMHGIKLDMDMVQW